MYVSFVYTHLISLNHFQDEEDGDTYEAPPCERPTIKVQPRQVEENVYLGIYLSIYLEIKYADKFSD